MLLFFVIVACLLSSVISSYNGDSCFDEHIQGTCVPLPRCKNLMDEIEAAGHPMPMYLRKKLLRLGCGFTSHDPLVCCTSQKPDFTDKPDTTSWGEGMRDKRPDTTSPNSVNNDRRDGVDSDDVSNHPNLRLLPRECGNIDSNRILGGNRTSLYEMPWMVVLVYDDGGEFKINCGGTLINERYVLTAAHCTQLGSRLTLDHVLLGDYDVNTNPDCEVLAGNLSCAPGAVNATIEEVIPHPGYRRQAFVDDIALIRLAEPANLNLDNIGAMCLPITRDLQRENLEGSHGTVAGWGIAEEGVQSNVLLSVQLPIIANNDCQKLIKGINLTDRQLCAGGVKNKDACGGDSGGPLLYPGQTGPGGVRYIQRGLVSFGPKRCGVGGLPAVFSRVSYYMKWILDNIRS